MTEARFQGKVAVVTGGASGLGRAIAERLAAEGATVVVADLLKPDGELRPGMEFVRNDVTNESGWAALIGDIRSQHGGLHVLVNNAGITGPIDASNPETTRLEDWQAVQQVNVEGVVLGCRAAIPLLAESGGGAIINMSSVASINPAPETMAYGASKAAVTHITRSVAVYCGRKGYGIRCNSVHPGIVLTPLFLRAAEQQAARERRTTDEVIARYRRRTITGDLQTVDDVASAVLFLASDAAAQITGTQLVVDGGMTANPAPGEAP